MSKLNTLLVNMVREFLPILLPVTCLYDYKTEVCFTVVYAMLDFREIAVSAQLGFTSSYTLSFTSTASLSLTCSFSLSAKPV